MEEGVFFPSSIISRLWEEMHSLQHEVVLLKEEVESLKKSNTLKTFMISSAGRLSEKKSTREEALMLVDEMLHTLKKIKHDTNV